MLQLSFVTFATIVGAELEAQNHEAQHGGRVSVIPESASWAAVKKPATKRLCRIMRAIDERWPTGRLVFRCIALESPYPLIR
jgi:hypothetical protein